MNHRYASISLSIASIAVLAPALMSSGCNDIKKEFAKELAKKTGLKRDVPHHDLSVAADCPPASLEKIATSIGAAIEIGAPTYNQGDHKGCYETYEKAARDISKTVDQCANLKVALLAGVANAQTRSDYTGKAWAMRDAFDGALELIDRKLTTSGDKAAALAPKREVPHHDLEILDGCPTEAIQRTEHKIARAIEVGAPLYNQKNAEACFRVYQGTALDLSSSLAKCEGAKKALQTGLSRADHQDGWEAKAWAMRDTFDGLLDVIDRKAGR